MAGRAQPPYRSDSGFEPLRISRAGSEDIGSTDELPPFSPGTFRDPVIEKADAAARTIEAYHARDAEREALTQHEAGPASTGGSRLGE
jgi:hypothetical protein